METSFQNKLIEILKTDSRFTDQDGELVKAAIIDRAWKIDRDLVKLLVSDASIKQKFFDEIEGHWVFNVNMFVDYISDKDFLDNSYTRFRNKIGLNIDGKYLKERGEVCLVWPYKDCVLEGGQTEEEEKRKEIFFNEILAQDEIDRLLDPKVLTNWKRYTKDGEQKVSEITRDENGVIKENLLIKGNNLLSLYCLKNQFIGKVKLIYIDPPYNTENDSFRYNDNFNHSSWLTFMKNRLELARKLLSPDGTIAISIDHNEIAYLLVLLDETFGIDNRKNIVTVKRGSVTGAKVINPGVVNITEYVVFYSNNYNYWKPNRVLREKQRDVRYNNYILNIQDSPENWKFTTLLDAFAQEQGIPKTKLKKTLGENYNNTLDQFVYDNADRIIQFVPLDESAVSQKALEIKEISENDDSRVYILERTAKEPYHLFRGKLILFMKHRLTEIDGKKTFSEPITDIWDDVLPNDLHNEGGVHFRKGKKPEKLLSRIIDLCTDKGDIVLDFFAGSGTTGAVCLKMNRQVIVCEQLDYTETLPLNRLLNTIKGEQSGISKAVNWKGGGDFIYCELFKYNEFFIDKTQSAKTSNELIEIWKDLSMNSFLSWYVNPEAPEGALGEFIEIGKSDNGVEKQKKLLCELLNKNQLYVNLSEIEDAKFSVSEHDKELNKQFYGEAYNA